MNSTLALVYVFFGCWSVTQHSGVAEVVEHTGLRRVTTGVVNTRAIVDVSSLAPFIVHLRVMALAHDMSSELRVVGENRLYLWWFGAVTRLELSFETFWLSVLGLPPVEDPLW